MPTRSDAEGPSRPHDWTPTSGNSAPEPRDTWNQWSLPALQPTPAIALAPQPPRRAVRALLEVVVSSGLVTQVLLMGVLAQVGVAPSLSIGYVATLVLLDTALLLVLIAFFLARSGDSLTGVLLGRRRPAAEVTAGLWLTPVVFAVVIALGSAILRFAPWLHNLEQNPLEAMLKSPRDAVLFGVVVIVGGGLREEVQRAFLLTRFEQSLGGMWVGLAISSVAFGAGHLVQGHDAAIITGVLGALWGVVYKARRSVVAPLVSHAIFDCAQIVLFRVGML
ncbi:MAG: type II CAAX endopeptidase family protein [Vicinamibacterales bacterium]